MVLNIPITNHKENFTIRLREGNWYDLPIVDNKGTKPTRCSLEISRREVKETPYLILDLKLVCPVRFWRNRTISAKNSVLPRVTPHLNTMPVTTICILKFIRLPWSIWTTVVLFEHIKMRHVYKVCRKIFGGLDESINLCSL